MILTGGVGLARDRAAGETNQGNSGKSHTQCWGTGADEIKDSLEQTPALKLWKSFDWEMLGTAPPAQCVVLSTERGRTAADMKQLL